MRAGLAQDGVHAVRAEPAQDRPEIEPTIGARNCREEHSGVAQPVRSADVRVPRHEDHRVLRIVRADDLRSRWRSRVRIDDLIMRQTISLPNVEGNFGLTANTRQSFPVNKTSKEEVALSLAVSPDNRSLFVSAGNTIRRIALDKYTLQPWSATVELPCRLIGVTEGGPNAWTVYALGSYYKGDGAKVDEFKTHLYTVLAPKN